jgi:hypothetical protein
VSSFGNALKLCRAPGCKCEAFAGCTFTHETRHAVTCGRRGRP